MACSDKHTLILSDMNNMSYWGENPHVRHYELGQYKAMQVSCNEFSSAFITLDGKLYTFGDDKAEGLGGPERHGYSRKYLYDTDIGQVLIPSNRPIIQVSCGTFHTACIDNDHNIWIFGQLGLGEGNAH